MHILVADDSKTSLTLIANSLSKLGHEVTAVESGQHAIEQFQINRPDLIILDVVMAKMDGFECAKKIREISGAENWIPIIFLSSSVDDVSIKKGIDAGGDDYLTKPFSEITLAAKIKAMQRISDMRQELFSTTKKLEKLSATDSLTGLYNRFHFDRSIVEKIAESKRFNRTLGLLFIDLDNFKIINDSFGHHVGDLLLQDVAKRLKSCVRISDFLGRIGGDEFAIIISEIADLKAAGQVAEKILQMVTMDFELENHYIRIGCSIGVACFPSQDTDEDNFVQHADIAMYHAKSLGKNNFQYFTSELNEKYKQQISLEHDLRFALERNELYLRYQPIFNLLTKEIVGLETLICWEHPKYGIISPNIFIPLAEEIGLISNIGSWVLSRACESARLWKLRDLENFKLAVNISSNQFIHDNFYELIIDILNQNGLPPSLLELELTETTVMSDNTDLFRETMKKLHDIGISISIDDFGTGYSSLTRLKRLTINTLKIDKTFVQDAISDLNSGIIVNCLIALGKNLGLKVIAEGVETKDQLEFLVAAGCLFGQGYFLSKPLDANNTTIYLKEAGRILI